VASRVRVWERGFWFFDDFFAGGGSLEVGVVCILGCSIGGGARKNGCGCICW